MLCAFGDQCIVILAPKIACLVQGASNYADGLELRLRVGHGFLVYGECLGEELIGYFFEAVAVCRLPAGAEQPQRQLGGPGSVDAGVERRDGRMEELVERRRLGGPVIVEVFALLKTPG